MSNDANEQLIMLAQMTSETDSSRLKSLAQVYLPISVFIIIGISLTVAGIWFTTEWQDKLGTSVTSGIQDSYFEKITASVTQIQHDSTLIKGFFDASTFVSPQEFETFTQSLLKQNPSTEFCLIIGYGKTPEIPYFNTLDNINDLEPLMASDTMQYLIKNPASRNDKSFIIETPDTSYIVYSNVFTTETKQNVLALTGISAHGILPTPDTPQAIIKLAIEDKFGKTLSTGAISNIGETQVSSLSLSDLNLVLSIHQKVFNADLFTYFRWMIIGFSILASFIFSIQFLHARQSVRKFIDLTIRRTDELTNINSDLVDEILERTKLQAELLNKNYEISEANDQLKAARVQLIQKEKLASLGLLSAGIAHEMNNPIGFVKSNLSMLRKYSERIINLVSSLDKIEHGETNISIKDRIEAAKVEYKYTSLIKNMPLTIEESLEGIERVQQIIHDLKLFSRMEESEWVESDIHEGIDSTLNIIRSEIKDIAEIHKDYGDIPKVTCVPSQINQVIMNLLMNSVHAIAPHGKIYIRTFTESTFLYIEIRDNGCGISQDIIDRIFDPFFTTKEVGKGTGLGLSLSYGIIEKHGGSLLVSTKIGVGSTFTIKLPLTRPETQDLEAKDA